MTEQKAYQATPHGTLLEQIMDPRVPKNEREHVAAEEIERLRNTIEGLQSQVNAHRDGRLAALEELAILRAELERLRAQEPVAWRHDCAGLCTNDVELWIDACPHCGKPRTAPPAPPAQRLTDELVDDLAREMVKGGKSVNWLARAIESALIPPGYVVVPVEPTREMVDAGSAIWDDTLEIYRAMIAAAAPKD